MDKDNEGFEDLNDTSGSVTEAEAADPSETPDETPDESPDGDVDIIEESAEPEADGESDQITTLNATIAVLQTENDLKDKEIERWKGINLQLLMSMPGQVTDDSVTDEDDGDDPEPYKEESGASSLFTTKGSN